MVKKPKAERPNTPSEEAVKERLTSQIKAISLFLQGEGYTVRREELKRGLGWRASSGVCRADDSRLVFVDRRAALGEQYSFLVETLRSIINSDRSSVERLPEDLRSLMVTESPSSLLL